MSKNKFPASSLRPFGLDTAGLEADAIVERKYFTPEVKLMESEEKTIIAKISCHDIDADGDLVYAAGCDVSRYQKNPVVMFAHDYSKEPIGKATELRITSDGVEAKIKFADTARANDMWSLVKGGFLRAHSVGFITRKELISGTKEFKEFVSVKGLNVAKNCKRIVTDWLLLEDSLVPIPSNPEALTQAISAKSISVSDSTMKDIGMDAKEEVTLMVGSESKDALPIVTEVEVKEVPSNPLGNTNTDASPVVISNPSDPIATVNLTINDAVNLMDINKPVQICSNGQTFNFQTVEELMEALSKLGCGKMEQTLQTGAMIDVPRAMPDTTINTGANGDDGACAKAVCPTCGKDPCECPKMCKATCLMCGKGFESAKTSARFCSKGCFHKYLKERVKRVNGVAIDDAEKDAMNEEDIEGKTLDVYDVVRPSSFILDDASKEAIRKEVERELKLLKAGKVV